MFRILHLSDIHIGKTYKAPADIAYKIASDIDHKGLSPIRCIAVTGDIFDGQAEMEDSALIDSAVEFFEILCTEINHNQAKDQIDKEDVIFVPGNHDLKRVEDFKERWSKYHCFLEKFYGGIPSFYDSENYSLLKEYKNYKVMLIGFNSCEIRKQNLFDAEYICKLEKYLDKDKCSSCGVDKRTIIEMLKAEKASEYDDYGTISMKQIASVRQKVRKLDDYRIVALFHHHFFLFPEIAQKFGDSSLIRNYEEVIQYLRYMNVSVVLHGHKHFALERPYIMEEYYDSAENIIDVFAGGSVGTDRKDEHTFGVLDLYEKKHEIKLNHVKFVYKSEKLEPLVRKQVPPQKMSGKVVKLLEILKISNPEKAEVYRETAEKSFHSYDSCNKIISWVSEALTGFTEVYKYLDGDANTILFLFYAIHYRIISYMKIVGKDTSYYESISKVWRSFYDENLAETDFTISGEDYHCLFLHKRLEDAASECDKLLNGCDNKRSQEYLAFTMLGMFFTDLYLVLTRYADDFKESIKYKVNIRIEENKFHENVPAPRIVVRSDADRRSVYIDMLCNEATAHKMAVLFVKEFDLLIHKFEDYFKIIGLKLYYLLPRIDKDRTKNALDNYNFEAYIPTLIPLLTGDNIYSSKVVFARELIQNSIDAISVREAKDKRSFSKKISIDLDVDKNGKRYFKITDNGMGMDRYKIERYFTSIGRSFYSGEEYKDLDISYKPISNFGIGFLSSFMVCQEIDVKTKYYMESSEGLKLHIPNYDGCFFIELDSDVEIGTEIKLYLDDSVTNEEIVDYIRDVMQDIRYDIEICCRKEDGKEALIQIPAYKIRRQKEAEEFKFFVPFLESGEVGRIDYEDVRSNAYIEKYEHGIFLYRTENIRDFSREKVLNSGIDVRHGYLDHIIQRPGYDISYDKNLYSNIIANFPANWLQLDVARENVTGLTDMICKQSEIKKLRIQIAESLYNQILQYIQYSETRDTGIPTVYLQDMIYRAMRFVEADEEKELYNRFLRLQYVIWIEFSESDICFRPIRGFDKGETIRITYTTHKAKGERNRWIPDLQSNRGDLLEINGPLKEGWVTSKWVPYRSLAEQWEERHWKVAYDGKISWEKDTEDRTKDEIKLAILYLLQRSDEEVSSFGCSDKTFEVINLEEQILRCICIGTEDVGIRITYAELEKLIQRRPGLT